MILSIKLDVDFNFLLGADYNQHRGSCISYQKREQQDLHEKYGKGFPKSYHEENTTIQQLWFNDKQIDYNDLGRQLNMEVITVSTILQPPGNIITLHRDTFFQINKLYPTDTRKKIRANIFLEDWKPGHFINYQDEDLEWQTCTHWKQGQGFIWDDSHHHLSANAGLVSKYTMQVSGFLK